MSSSVGSGEDTRPEPRRKQNAITTESRSPAAAIQVAITRRIPKALADVPRQGMAAVGQVARSLKRPSPQVSPNEAALQQRLNYLEAELKLERTVTEFLEGEAMRLESAVEEERHRAEEYRERAESLETQMHDARRTTMKLISASRDSLALLKKVRPDIIANPPLMETLAPLVQDLKEVAQAAAELQTYGFVREASHRASPQ